MNKQDHYARLKVHILLVDLSLHVLRRNVLSGLLGDCDMSISVGQPAAGLWSALAFLGHPGGGNVRRERGGGTQCGRARTANCCSIFLLETFSIYYLYHGCIFQHEILMLLVSESLFRLITGGSEQIKNVHLKTKFPAKSP